MATHKQIQTQAQQTQKTPFHGISISAGQAQESVLYEEILCSFIYTRDHRQQIDYHLLSLFWFSTQTLFNIAFKLYHSFVSLWPVYDLLDYFGHRMNPYMHNYAHLIQPHKLASMIIFVIIWLLLVFLFFLFLHLYAKKFLPQVGETDRTPPILIIGARVHRHGSFLVNVNNNGTMSLRKAGLESCLISTIPQFVFQEEQQEGRQCDHGLECVICLSPFENGQVGRRLPSCDHAFHVECIDMWLHTHATCPICRASAVHVSALPPEDGVGPPQESAQRPSDLREMSGEVSNRLEVIVEVPSVENQ